MVLDRGKIAAIVQFLYAASSVIKSYPPTRARTHAHTKREKERGPDRFPHIVKQEAERERERERERDVGIQTVLQN